jgi:predicted transposase YbfD/YdcC
MTKAKVREEFDKIEDKRYKNFVKIKLTDVLIVVMCAVMCGWTRYEEIEIYGKEKIEYLKRAFGVEKTPSDSMISRVLSAVSATEVVDAVIEIMRSCITKIGDLIHIDGKALRQTYQDKRTENLEIVTAFCSQTGLILGSKSIPEKTNEIPVLREMLELFNIAGKTITADALHCQQATIEKIVELGGHYFIGLKKNQKNFYEDANATFEKTNSDNAEIIEETEKNKGRIENRKCFVINDNEFIARHKDWRGLASLVVIERLVTHKNITTFERSFYIADVIAPPKYFLDIARAHWQIEGGLHYSLDCGAFDEDDCSILNENANVAMNIFRKYAYGLHKNYISSSVTIKSKPSIKSQMKRCLLDNSLLSKVLTCS